MNQQAMELKRGQNARRSQRVLVSLSVLVHGEVTDEAPIIEKTRTLVVNAHGALISLAMKVLPGQQLVLENGVTRERLKCRVVHLREQRAPKNEVGIEFLTAAPKFWRIDFPPADWKMLLD